MWNMLVFGRDEEEQDCLLDDTQGLCSLSPLQRIYGFVAALASGLVLMFLSLVVFARPIKFAFLFTFGNLLAVGSTAFLIGPLQQTRMMLDPVRLYATTIYIGCVVLSLICSLWIHNKILTLLAILVEICGLFWYSLSYIPFAHRVVSDLMLTQAQLVTVMYTVSEPVSAYDVVEFQVAGNLSHQIIFNTTFTMSNVVGPKEEISFYGLPVAYIALIIYGHSQAFTVHLQSYANKMTIVLAVDQSVIPNPHQLCDDFVESFNLIKAAALEK